MVDLGKALPDPVLELPLVLSGGGPATLASYRGNWLALYFYPRDSTPGCTTEGGDFNTLLGDFQRLGAQVVGVSRDSVRSHDTFRARQGFRFPLVSDGDEALCRAFDVIREKTMYGRTALGIQRSTFLLDPVSRIAAVWRGVRVPGHAQAVLDALRAAQAA